MTALGYLLGRTRSKEGRLLTAADWQKFQTADSLPDWLSRLQNTDYAAAEQTGTYAEFEKYLHQELAALRKDLFGADQGCAEIFWRKYDWHNLKILLKAKLTAQNLEHYLLPLGKTSLADFDQRLVEKAAEIYAQTQDFCRLDYFLDQEYFEWLRKQAAPFGPVVREYAQALIDAANFKLWYSGAHKNYAYFAGGRAGLFRQDPPEETLRSCFPGIELPAELDDGLIEKALDDYTSRILFRGRYAHTQTALFCFLLAKENEIKNLKTMYLRQSRELPVLQNYLRSAYG